jgi:energy-coupling factor transport system ATP-binding protein
VIQVKNLKYRYPTGEHVLSGIDLTVSDGEYLLVCGANGSGKSTLAYTFNGLIPHHFGGILEGSINVSGLDTAFYPPSELFSRVGLVLQNSDAQLFNATVEDELAFGLESLGMAPEDISLRVRNVTAEFEMEHLLSHAPSKLSGGERKLVSIAAVLGADPPVVVLDEPFANLDWSGSGNLQRILSRVHRRGTTVIVVEHVLEDLPPELNRCVLVDQGRISADGPVDAMRPILHEARLIPRYSAPPALTAGPPLLQVEHLKAEREGRVILRDVSFSIRRGETVALVGRNGCGKTTLVKHLNGLLRPSSGSVAYGEQDVTALGPSRMASLVGISFQNPNDQFFTSSVGEELLAGPRALGKMRNARFEEMLDLFQLKDFWDRSPYRLSEGEKRRVAIGSILAMEPEMLVLDEPTAGQDGRFRESLAASLNRLAETGLTTLVVTHDLDFASAVASRWILLEEGVVAVDGAASEVRGAVKGVRTDDRGTDGAGDEQP